jgi:cytoskeletal protein CcmA (bactofilin family)
LRIAGAVVTKGCMRVDGVVNGDIQCGVLEIGVSGAVNGDVVAEVVRLEGSINGTVNANAVYLMKTARMHGDVHHAKLSVEAGAVVDGNYRQRDAVEATIETRLGAAASPSTLGGDNKIASGSVVLQGPHAPA